MSISESGAPRFDKIRAAMAAAAAVFRPTGSSTIGLGVLQCLELRGDNETVLVVADDERWRKTR